MYIQCIYLLSLWLYIWTLNDHTLGRHYHRYKIHNSTIEETPRVYQDINHKRTHQAFSKESHDPQLTGRLHRFNCQQFNLTEAQAIESPKPRTTRDTSDWIHKMQIIPLPVPRKLNALQSVTFTSLRAWPPSPPPNEAPYITRMATPTYQLSQHREDRCLYHSQDA